jgi:hypothetical protein
MDMQSTPCIKDGIKVLEAYNKKSTAAAMKKWGGIASFLMAVSFIAPSFIYLTGNLGDALGPIVYSLADLLYGPVWAVSLIAVVLALRERIGKGAQCRMNLALLASFAAACAFVAVACIRAANRHYHLIHPELHLESSSTVLTVWTTLVAGIIGAAWHFLGWAWLLIGSAGWTSGRFPRAQSILYLLAGAISLLIYLVPIMEANALAVSVIVSIWQGVFLIRADQHEPQASNANVIQPD